MILFKRKSLTISSQFKKIWLLNLLELLSSSLLPTIWNYLLNLKLYSYKILFSYDYFRLFTIPILTDTWDDISRMNIARIFLSFFERNWIPFEFK